MALQTVIDKESGQTDGMAVVVTVYDDAGADISTEAAVSRAQLDAPSSFFGVNQDAYPGIQRLAPYAVAVTINYRQRQFSVIKRPEVGEIDTVRFYSPPIYTKPRTLHSYLSPSLIYSEAGDVTADWPALAWGIDFPSGPQFLVQTPGHTFEAEPVAEGYHFYLNNAAVTRDYIRIMRDMVTRGVWNNAEFLGDEAGTVQFVSFAAQERSPNDWDLDFGFGHVPKRENVQVAPGITLPEVYGYQYWYERFKLLPIEQGGNVVQVIQQTELVVLGQVWELDDFSAFNLIDPYNLA